MEAGKMLLGQYEGKVGAKGRLAFPKKFRSVLGDKLIITQGYENSLIVVSEEGWQKLLEGTEGKPFTVGAARQTERFLLGGASEVRLDAKGRFIVPAYLRNYAKITSEVIFIGLARYVEIWDRDRWGEYSKELAGKAAVIAERLNREEEVKNE